jgi:hypothetical protein
LRDSFYDAVNVWDYVKTVVRRLMNEEMENIWEESLKAEKVLFRYLSEGSEEKPRNTAVTDGRRYDPFSNRGSPE